MQMVADRATGQWLMYDQATLEDRVTQLPPRLEIETRPGNWVKVTPSIFRSWAGGRRLDGHTYTGPVYNYLTNDHA